MDIREIVGVVKNLTTTQWVIIGLILFAGGDGLRGYLADQEAGDRQVKVAENLAGDANNAIDALSEEISDLTVKTENLRLRIQLLEMEEPVEVVPIVRTGRPPVVEIFSPTVEDILKVSREDIRDVVSENQAAFQECYTHQILERGDLFSGKVQLTFTVERFGQVSGVVVDENTTPSHELGVCLSRTVRTMSFKPLISKDPVTVTYPFTFKPSETAVQKLSLRRTKAAKKKVKAKTDQLKVSVPTF